MIRTPSPAGVQRARSGREGLIGRSDEGQEAMVSPKRTVARRSAAVARRVSATSCGGRSKIAASSRKMAFTMPRKMPYWPLLNRDESAAGNLGHGIDE